MFKYLLLCTLFLASAGWLNAQFPEHFEGPDFPPQAWVRFTNGIGQNFNWQQTDDAFMGETAAFVRWENVEEGYAEDWLVTPRFTPTARAHTLSFYQKDSYANNYFSEYTVRVSLAGQNDPEDFQIVDQQYETDLRLYYTHHEVDLSDYIGKAIYVAFVMTNDDGDNWVIDELALPACDRPKGLFAANFTSNGADLGWTDDGAGAWNVEIVEKGQRPSGVPTITGITAVPYSWTGGQPYTQYEFFVWADCGDGSVSQVSGPYEFLTDCANSSCEYLFLLADSYGDDWNEAWIEVLQNGLSVGVITQEERGFGPYEKFFRFCDGQDFELVWHAGNWDQECIFAFYDGYDQLYYSFGAGEAPADGEVFYASRADCTPVTCRFPYDVSVADFGIDGATFSWTEKDNATVWDIEIVPFGDQPSGNPTVSGISQNPYRWTGGSPGEYYQVYVRAVCGPDDVSKWSKPAVFATLCDQVLNQYPYQEDFSAEILLPECWTSFETGDGERIWTLTRDYETEDTLVAIAHENAWQDAWLISPAFDLSAATGSVTISFDWKMSYYWMVYPYDRADLELWLSTDLETQQAKLLWTETDRGEFPSFEWMTSSVDLSAFSGEDRVWFAFRYRGQEGATAYLDNFRLEDESGSITSVANESHLANGYLFPNPADDEVYLHPGTISRASIRIFDVTGQVKWVHDYDKQGLSGPVRIEIADWQPGIYFIRIGDGWQTRSLKLVKL